MRVEIVPAGDMEVKDVVVEAGRIKLTPLFFGKGFASNVALIKVIDDAGKLVSMTLLQLSGVDGHIKTQDRSAPVPAAMEKRKKLAGEESAKAAEPARK